MTKEAGKRFEREIPQAEKYFRQKKKQAELEVMRRELKKELAASQIAEKDSPNQTEEITDKAKGEAPGNSAAEHQPEEESGYFRGGY